MIRLAKFRTVLPFLALFVGLLLVWQFAADYGLIKEFFFSNPTEVTNALLQGVATGPYLSDVFASAIFTLKGVAYGLLIASPLVAVALRYRLAEEALDTTFAVLIYLPILAIAPLFLVWLGPGQELKIGIATFLASLMAGRALIEINGQVQSRWEQYLSRVSAPYWRSFRIVILPEFVKGLRARVPDLVSVSFLGVFVGEFIAANEGLGYRILRAGKLYQSDQVLALAFLSILVLIAIQLLLVFLGWILTLCAEEISKLGLDVKE